MQAEFSGTHKEASRFAHIASELSPSKPNAARDKKSNFLQSKKEACRNAHLAANKNFSDFPSDLSAYARVASKSFLSKLLSASVAVCCLASLSNIFTVGTGVYAGSTFLGTLQSTQSYENALVSAKKQAQEFGIDISKADLKTVPTLILQQSIISEDSLCDKILLAHDGLTKGCEVYFDGICLFTAPDEKTAKAAVEKHISTYSMSGEAELSAPVVYKTGIVPSSSISDEEECVRIMSENSDINVISVVSSTASEAIPFETHTKNDDALYIGESVTECEGRYGNRKVSKETVYENGNEKTTRITSQDIVLQPVARIVKVGTKPKNVLESGLIYPLDGVLSSPFGSRWGRMHEGIDIAVPEGTPVKAAECGTVSYVSENAGGYGKLVRISHGYGIETAYAHLSKIQVTVGQSIPCGATIALSGNTGRSTGPHLHFEITKDKNPVDPMKYLK